MCRRCNAASNMVRRQKMPKEELSGRARRASLKSKYGITPEDYDAMFDSQSGRCAICGTDRAGGSGDRLHVDHSHETGEVRGLLCGNCNRGIGHFKDSPDTLREAADYLAGTVVV